MSFSYETNPKRIEQQSFQKIRSLTDLNRFSADEQQVVMRMIHSIGLPQIADKIRFSHHACERGQAALSDNNAILCDVEMVKQGITKRMIQQPPLCFLNHEKTRLVAKRTGETRSMAAVSQWTPHLDGAVVIIGNAPTALFRLLETIQTGAPKPALIIGIPVGFIGAEESKQALWDHHHALGIECITLLGREGGSAVSAAACNALLRCLHGERY